MVNDEDDEGEREGESNEERGNDRDVGIALGTPLALVAGVAMKIGMLVVAISMLEDWGDNDNIGRSFYVRSV